jgi:hypothetical protein
MCLRVDGWVGDRERERERERERKKERKIKIKNERNKGIDKFFLIINYSNNECEVGTFTYTTALLCFTTKHYTQAGFEL